MNMHLLANKPLDEVAMDALREFAPRDGKPYWLAYSGGKDSDNILDLTKRSGVLFEAHYSYIVLDPPELRRHIREMMRDPTNHLTIDPPLRSIVSLAHEKQFLPRRSARWCCELMKEGRSPPDRTVITGVRWAESNRRRSRGLFEQRRSGRGKCVNPIIGWETSDVWTYIRERGLPYSELYDQGMKRVGCVLCPLARNVRPDYQEKARREIERWPGIARIWYRVCEIAWSYHKAEFESPQALWDWWIRSEPSEKKDDGECGLFGSPVEVAP
jgi:phosphoadenosine phosphosulfate reductase